MNSIKTKTTGGPQKLQRWMELKLSQDGIGIWLPYAMSGTGDFVSDDPIRFDVSTKPDTNDILYLVAISQYENPPFGTLGTEFTKECLKALFDTRSNDKHRTHFLVYFQPVGENAKLFGNLDESELQCYRDLGDRSLTEGVNYAEVVIDSLEALTELLM